MESTPVAGVATDVLGFQLLNIWLLGDDMATAAPKRTIFYRPLKPAEIGRFMSVTTIITGRILDWTKRPLLGRRRQSPRT
jgi:hypothetical protein